MIMSATERVYYAVGRGKEIGIYDSWKECKAQTDGFFNAKFRKFYSLEEAKEFVNFWKNYSSPVKESNESKSLMESEGDIGKFCEESKILENGHVGLQPAKEQEPTSSNSLLHNSHIRSPSPHLMSFEGRLTQKDVDVLALNLRLDSFEKRFDACLKEVGGIASEISHLRSDIKELKETLQFASLPGSASSPRKGRDGLMQTTLRFSSSSSAAARSSTSQNVDPSSDEPDKKRGRMTNRKLSRSEISTEESVTNLLNTLKPETVELSTFNIDKNDFVEVYTDGCSLSNGKFEARAGIGIWFGDGHPLNVSEPVTGPATSIFAEIHAARVAMQLAIGAGVTKLKILTDSEFTINCATKWIPQWKRNGWVLTSGGRVKNRKELEMLDFYASKITVQWEKVPGHAKIRGNETADRLANQGAAKYKRLELHEEFER